MKRSVPSEPTIEIWSENVDKHPTARHSSVRRPDNPLQALMETPPNGTPLDSWQDLMVLRELVAACVDMLEPEDKYVIEALFVEGISLRALAERMGIGRQNKTKVERIRDRALLRLQELLEQEPTIRSKYE